MSNVRTIQWSMWGNEALLEGAVTFLIGGAVGVTGGAVFSNFQFWIPIGIYAMVVGTVIAILEYPRSKKIKGKSTERSHQEIFTKLVNCLPFPSNCAARGFIYLVFCLPGIVIVPTLFGTVAILVGSCVYFFAGSKKEHWAPILPNQASGQPTDDVSLPPRQPPPRLPPQP